MLFEQQWPCLEDVDIKCLGIPRAEDKLIRAAKFPPSLKTIQLCKFLQWLSDDQIATIFSDVKHLTSLTVEQSVVMSRSVLKILLQSARELRCAKFIGFEFFNGQNLMDDLKVYCPLLEDLTLHTAMRNLPETEMFDTFAYLKHLLLEDKGYSVEYTVSDSQPQCIVDLCLAPECVVLCTIEGIIQCTLVVTA